MTKERTIEGYLVAQVEGRGWLAVKWGLGGWPDRLVLADRGRAGMVELKAPGKKPRALQAHMLARLERLGFVVRSVDSFAGIDSFMDALCKT